MPLSTVDNITAPSITVEDTSRDATPKGDGLVDNMRTMNIGTAAAQDEEDVPQENQSTTHKRPRRKQRQPKSSRGPAPETAGDASPSRGARASNRGKGWRETPMLQDTASFQPFNSLKRNRAKGKNQALNDNGWASEDVTDVQEAGDFDFESSLAKFDKRSLFDEMRKDDQVDDADRLVAHNRLPRPMPGTAGGKNLHHTENVLDGSSPALKPDKAPLDDFWKSEADDGAVNGGAERSSGRELGSRQGSRRGESKLPANRRSQSRKASAATVVGQGPSRVNSGISVQDAVRSRPDSRNVDRRKQLSVSAPAAGFVSFPSNRHLEVLSPLQMLNLTSIAQNDLGFTEEMMTENAGRGIAEVTLHILNDPAIKVARKASPNNATPTIVILAGNNKSGSRAIAAGRHLQNKGVDVDLCVVGIDKSERDLSADVARQLRLFKSFGGRVYTKGELLEHIRQMSMPVISMDAPRSVLPQAPPMPITLIIDALLGHALPFDDLRASDQATTYELIGWMNRNPAFVMSVDCPSGVDHTTGKPTLHADQILAVQPRYVVSVGAPSRGLFEAVSRDADNEKTAPTVEDTPLDWKLFLVDVGLGSAVWKRAGMKNRRGIDFEHKWALEVRYRARE